MSKSKKIDVTKLVNNPFVGVDFEIVVNRVGEEDVPLERCSYSKVFRLVVNREKVDRLSLNGKQLFLWILYRVDYGNDWILVERDKYMKSHEISSVNTYKSAVENLVDNGIIAYSTIKNIFFINPKIFFMGSRAKKYPENVKIYEANNERKQS